MKKLMTLLLLGGFAGLLAIFGCEPDEDDPINGGYTDGDADGDGDGGTDGDSDGDTDGDGDGDGDTDGDGDGDADGDADGDSDGDSDGDPTCGDFDGVDLLVVVDNSLSMEEEQQILATSFFTLINSLVDPVEDPDWDFQPADNVRVAVTTSDMGLQYGEDGSIDGWDDYGADIKTCNVRERGDNGMFMGVKVEDITVESGQIRCDGEGTQCPTADWSCNGGVCDAPGGDGTTTCPDVSGDWAETTEGSKNDALATQFACLAQQGQGGCGVEQQLEASVKALSHEDQKEFLVDTHLLAVIQVSDEEDCSIADKGLFETEQWTSTGSSSVFNTACNLPESNETDYLFDATRFKEELVAAKGDENAVVFAAIVGVPPGESAGCEGLGDELDSCLEHDKMQLEIGDFQSGGTSYKHFNPACERGDVTSARPGRRYVKVAQDFGEKGYVYSICNADWSEAMRAIAELIAQCMAPI